MEIYTKKALMNENTAACAKALEILHAQGIESAEAWLNKLKINTLYDHIEEEYLSIKKVIYFN
jgi:hypothetical protein